ncbi:MAG: FecR domain-containing protein [Lachnospiraceae bacterium]|nr:FecR domain-containing protein [Lachnospiraceae bacterium]
MDLTLELKAANEEPKHSRGKYSTKSRIIVTAIVVTIILSAIIAIVSFFAGKITARIMRIAEFYGIVHLEDNGNIASIQNNIRLHDGNALNTEDDSYVSISLDKNKLVTVLENSRTEFLSSGKNIEMRLSDGSLFFNVQKQLADDESFDIKTATMVVGIRGT